MDLNTGPTPFDWTQRNMICMRKIVHEIFYLTNFTMCLGERSSESIRQIFWLSWNYVDLCLLVLLYKNSFDCWRFTLGILDLKFPFELLFPKKTWLLITHFGCILRLQYAPNLHCLLASAVQKVDDDFSFGYYGIRVRLCLTFEAKISVFKRG